MKKKIHWIVDLSRISIEKIKAISDDLAAIGIDIEHTGIIEYDNENIEQMKEIREIFDKYLLQEQ